MNIIVFTLVVLLFWICFFGLISNHDELYKSYCYKGVLKHLYKVIQYTEQEILIAVMELSLPDCNPEARKSIVKTSKNAMKELNVRYKEVISGIKDNPTQYTFIYKRMYKKCLSRADSLRDFFCENFSKFY